MARFLLALYHPNNQSLPSSSSNNITSLFLLLAGVAGVASIVMSLCTTYKHFKMSKDGQSGLAPSSPPQRENKLLSQISSKALVVVKMVSWKKGEQVEVDDDDDDDDEDEDEAVWRKTILMGDKCRPVDFSGQILYDSQGNPLPEPDPARSHRSSEIL